MSALTELGGRFRVAKTQEFLDRILPLVPVRLDSLYSQLVQNNEYDEDAKRWARFDAPEAANDPHGSFVYIANAVHEAACNDARELGIQLEIEMCWLDMQARASRSQEGKTPLLRPQVASVLGKAEDMEAWEKTVDATALAKQKEMLQERTETATSDPWWLRVHVPVEVKAENREEDIRDAVTQMCEYMHQIFLSVWLCDRSGLLGTETSINIHEDPRAFITVIASFSLFPPEGLGWDPTMKLYLPPCHPRTEPLYVHSYGHAVTPEHYHTLISDPHWVIAMPSEDRMTTEQFITVDALGMNRAEMMCGRASLIWRAVKLDDFCRQGGQKIIYVLKQLWLGHGHIGEGNFYDEAHDCRHVAQIYSYEDVIVGDCYDNTLTRIRRWVNASSTQACEADKIIVSPLYIRSSPECPDQFVTDHSAREPVPRKKTRLLLATYGWPIAFFKDIPELLRVIRDAIDGHQILYHKGILHGDISAGNILISPKGSDFADTGGSLIDFDTAKQTKTFDAPYRLEIDNQAPYRNNRAPLRNNRAPYRNKLADVLADIHKPGIDQEAANVFRTLSDQGRHFHASIVAYVEEVLEDKPHLKNSTAPLTCDDLDLHLSERNRPDFSYPLVKFRAGTLAFMSYEVMTQSYYWPELHTRISWFHDSIHDLEALLWVVIFLGLSSGGPGGITRDEFSKERRRDGSSEKLRQCILGFFQNPQEIIEESRDDIMREPATDLDEHILSQFHPYFDELKPMVSEWWRILRRGFRSGIYDGIHDRFLAVVNKTMAQVGSSFGPPTAETAREIDRRKNDLEKVWSFGLGATPLVLTDAEEDQRPSPGEVDDQDDMDSMYDNMNPTPECSRDNMQTSSPSSRPSKRRRIQ